MYHNRSYAIWTMATLEHISQKYCDKETLLTLYNLTSNIYLTQK